jgi:hypothetical protein
MEAHYVRKDTSKKFLSANLNLSELYRLYKKMKIDKNEKPISKTKYSNIFYTFNLTFHTPKKDRCTECFTYEHLTDPYDEQIKQQENHIKQKNEAREEKSKDKENAIKNDTFFCAVFDLQKVLTTPYLTAGQVYHSRKLNSFNLSIYDLAKKQATHNVWDETEGNRGACEVASILYQTLRRLEGITEVTLYSDRCPGQNHNHFIVTMFHHFISTASNSSIKIINHKFLCTGHSENECDSSHAAIEVNKKNVPVYVPFEWYNVIRTAKKQKPYIVIPFDHTEFYNFKLFHRENKLSMKVDESGNKISWTQIRWFRYEKENSIQV